MQHLRGRIAKSYVRTYASSTVSRHFGAETKTLIMYGDVGIAEQQKVREQAGRMAWNRNLGTPAM